MLESFSDILMDIPWETNETTHMITLSKNTPIKAQKYSFSLHMKKPPKLNCQNDDYEGY